MNTVHGLQKTAFRRVRQLETFSGPRGFLKKYLDVVASGDEIGAEAFRNSVSYQHLDHLVPQAAYQRTNVTSGIVEFRDIEAKNRKLVVLVTGRRLRFGCPLPLVVEALGRTASDILVLRDPFDDHYRSGIGSAAPDFHSLVKFVSERLRGYEDLIVMGNSMGAGAAIAIAGKLQAKRGVGLSVVYPWDIGRIIGGKLPNPFLPLCACQTGDFSQSLFIANGDHVEDQTRAATMSKMLGAQHADIPNEAGHGVLRPFVLSNRLRPLMALITDLRIPLPYVAARLRNGGP